jgi:glycosyltransferase involved in cell wall biosynthesis
MNTPLVSVIIPAYNGERYLAEAIESVLVQTYRPIEIIVVDDGSTDNSAGIAQSHKEINYIYQSNRGVSVARNAGIASAQGEFIAFLDADDRWTPDKLSVQMNYLLNHPEIQYAIARVKFFLEPGHPIPPGFRKELLENDHVGRIPSTLVVRKSLFDVIGKFKPDLTTAEDVDWFTRANDKNVPMVIVSKTLLYKRIHNTNLSLNALVNNQNLLKALRHSIDRRRNRESEEYAGE